MTEREYLLVQTVTSVDAAYGSVCKPIPVRGVASERDLRTLRRLAMRIVMRGHAAIAREGGK